MASILSSVVQNVHCLIQTLVRVLIEAESLFRDVALHETDTGKVICKATTLLDLLFRGGIATWSVGTSDLSRDLSRGLTLQQSMEKIGA
jgi:hypothetical protein